jgi:hypothetical protein
MCFTINSDLDTSLYTIAWITCDNDEYQTARLMLDKQHGDYAPRHRFCGGSWYTLGEAAGHNVVLITAIANDDQIRELACLSIDLEIHFPNVCACMAISVGAGILREGHDVRLGDVVVSTPDRQYGGVVNVDEDYVDEPNTLLGAVEPATLTRSILFAIQSAPEQLLLHESAERRPRNDAWLHMLRRCANMTSNGIGG